MLLPALFATAFALEVDVHVVPQSGESASLTFLNVKPGVEDTVEVPCGRAPSCRIAVSATPDGDEWVVTIRVEEMRKRLFGGAKPTLLAQPTLRVPADLLAEYFVGGEVSVETARGTAYQLDGLHIQARVREEHVTASR